MSLSRKLHALRQQAGVTPSKGTAHDPPQASVRERLARVHTRDPRAAARRGVRPVDAATLARQLGGTVLAEGLVEVRVPYELDRAYGRQSLNPLSGRLTALADGAALDPRGALFLDTETTGLAGGTGTVVFMVGAGRIEADRLVVYQWLLSGFAGESALMRHLADFLGQAESIVTYNGKSFDVPLLRDRARLAGVELPWTGVAHLDLLHPMRRAFRDVWSDCRLQTAERELIGRQRTDDLPGAEAPAAWLALIRRGEVARIQGVLEHNANDIVALAALWAALDEVHRVRGTGSSL